MDLPEWNQSFILRFVRVKILENREMQDRIKVVKVADKKNSH